MTTRSEQLFNKMKDQFMQSVPEDQKQAFQKFGEKFHQSFDVESGAPVDSSVINLEEALSYVVESLKSGLHPRYLNADEIALLVAGYGEEWFRKWGYQKEDLS